MICFSAVHKVVLLTCLALGMSDQDELVVVCVTFVSSKRRRPVGQESPKREQRS